MFDLRIKGKRKCLNKYNCHPARLVLNGRAMTTIILVVLPTLCFVTHGNGGDGSDASGVGGDGCDNESYAGGEASDNDGDVGSHAIEGEH